MKISEIPLNYTKEEFADKMFPFGVVIAIVLFIIYVILGIIDIWNLILVPIGVVMLLFFLILMLMLAVKIADGIVQIVWWMGGRD